MYRLGSQLRWHALARKQEYATPEHVGHRRERSSYRWEVLYPQDRQKEFNGSARWITIAGLSVLIVIGGVSALLASRWPFTRDAVTNALQERFSSTVEIKTFHGTYLTPGCVAEGVTFRRNNDRNAPPFATVQKLTIQGGYIGLFTTPKRIGRVRVEGLRVLVPPRSEATNAGNKGAQHASDSKHSALVIGEIIADGTMVEFASDEQRTGPLKFEIHRLTLDSVADDRPMSFHASLLNPEPPGEIRTDGQFGPLRLGDFGQTALSGSYTFQHANLGVFPGIAGTLSSDGTFNGMLGHIDVEGAADVPDFQLKTSGHPVHLHTQFQAIVNGTDGDVGLQLVRAQFERTSVVSRGEVAGTPGVKGKSVSIEITESEGRIEDWLRLFRSNRPSLTGPMNFRATVAVPSGQREFMDKVNLQGDFGIDPMRLTSSETQKEVNYLSQRARGEKEDDDPASVVSNVKGHIVLKGGIATFSTLSFSVPGALAHLHGTYGLLNEHVNLHGTLQLDTKLSKESKGIKSLLLKSLEPFLKKKAAGEIVPIKVTGTYTRPAYGVDY